MGTGACLLEDEPKKMQQKKTIMKGDILNARLACVLPSAKFEIINLTVQKEFWVINTPILGGGKHLQSQ